MFPIRSATLVTSAVLAAAAQPGCSSGIEILPVVWSQGGLNFQPEYDRPYLTRGNRTLRMDIFHPAPSDRPTPAVVLAHGGSWLFGDRSNMHDWAADLAGQGYLASSVAYGLVPDGSVFPEPVADVAAAVTHLRDHATELNIDPDRVGLLGVSAGAHLVLLAGLTDDPAVLSADPLDVRAIVDISGPTDFTADASSAASWQVDLVTRFIGATYADASDRWRLASPVNHVREDGPPVFILHGARDDIVPIAQARSLRTALEQVGQAFEYFEPVSSGHFFGSRWASATVQNHRALILRFLDEHL